MFGGNKKWFGPFGFFSFFDVRQKPKKIIHRRGFEYQKKKKVFQRMTYLHLVSILTRSQVVDQSFIFIMNDSKLRSIVTSHEEKRAWHTAESKMAKTVTVHQNGACLPLSFAFAFTAV